MVSDASTSSPAAESHSLPWAERSALFTEPDHASGADAVARRHRAVARGIWGTVVPLLTLVALLAAGRIVWLIFACPYTLVEDEAHYWTWSRHLDLSYYSKGPGIAWAMRAATELFGTSEWAVRIPAVVASAIATFAVGALVADIAQNRPVSNPLAAGTEAAGRRKVRSKWAWRPGLYAAICFALAPINFAPAMLSTIDGPYVACWALACWAAWRAFERRSITAWFLLGLAIGIGFLFKYTILLVVPGLLVYVLARPRMRTARASIDLALGSAIVLVLTMLPVLIWNWRNGWPTARHLLGHLGLAGGDMPLPENPEPFSLLHQLLSVLEFIATQVTMVGPALLLAIPAILWASRTRGDEDYDAGSAFLLCCAAPILLFYLIVAFFAEAEGNWAMGGYVTLLALAGWYASDEIPRYRAMVRKWRAEGRPDRQGILRRQPETIGQILWHFSIGYGLVAAAAMLYLEPLSRVPYVRQVIPIGRVMGADVLAAHVHELAESLGEKTGQDPFVMSKHYGVASQLSFYLPGRPNVLCANAHLGGRLTQFDYWAETDLGRPDLLGRPAVLIGGTKKEWARFFARVENVGHVEGDRKEEREAWLAYEYLGPTAKPEPVAEPKPEPSPTPEGDGPTFEPLKFFEEIGA